MCVQMWVFYFFLLLLKYILLAIIPHSIYIPTVSWSFSLFHVGLVCILFFHFSQTVKEGIINYSCCMANIRMCDQCAKATEMGGREGEKKVKCWLWRYGELCHFLFFTLVQLLTHTQECRLKNFECSKLYDWQKCCRTNNNISSTLHSHQKPTMLMAMFGFVCYVCLYMCKCCC